MTPTLTTVHDAMMRATDEARKEPKVPYVIKIDLNHRQMCEQICERNGTTLPEFIRQCMAGLIFDYTMKDPSQLLEDCSDKSA